jgi:hypothetical protein
LKVFPDLSGPIWRSWEQQRKNFSFDISKACGECRRGPADFGGSRPQRRELGISARGDVPALDPAACLGACRCRRRRQQKGRMALRAILQPVGLYRQANGLTVGDSQNLFTGEAEVQASLSSAHFLVRNSFPLLIPILFASAEARVAYSPNRRVRRWPPPSAGGSSA